MAKHSPNSDPSNRNRSLQNFMDAGGNGRSPGNWSAKNAEDAWGDGPAKGETDEVKETSEQEHEEILNRVRGEADAGAKGKDMGSSADAEEVEKLGAENQELRSIIAELRQLLDEQSSQGEGAKGSSEEKEREYEALLEEKTEMIRNLHVRMQELERLATEPSGGGGAAAGEQPDNNELVALSDELERERCQLEQERRQLEEDRRQLREDEEAMMRQMREMELQMAKERAELARQRNELQRLHSEIRHELELAQRDAAVNERLRLLQRRHQEVAGDDDSANKKKSSSGTPAPSKQPKKDSGGGSSGGSGGSIMRRFFGGGENK
jgi:chromosome segregation ATPase